MSTITANELKTRGVSSIEEHLAETEEAIISVRGKDRYVVMSLEHYQQMRDMELEAAWLQAKADKASGRYTTETVVAHIARISEE